MPKNSRKPPVAKNTNYPAHHPARVAELADTMPWKTNFPFTEVGAYSDSITKLNTRGYSFKEIAQWLNTTLEGKLNGRKITRGQVYRVFKQSAEQIPPFIGSYSIPHISDENAEKAAEQEDNQTKSDKKKN